MLPRDTALRAPALAALMLILPTFPASWGVEPDSASKPALSPPSVSVGPAQAPIPALTVVDRSIALERGEGMTWRIDYRLRNDGQETLVVPPGEVSARVAGWVSNSRATGHAIPRHSEVMASGRSGLVGTAEVIASPDEARRCREHLVVQVWPADAGFTPPEPVARAIVGDVPIAVQPTLELAPGALLRVRLRLEHQHPVCDAHTALLGERQLAMRLGTASLVDTLPLDTPVRIDSAPVDWPPPPVEVFRDDRIFFSAPDSLHLEAHIPGRRSYRFPDFRNVAGGSRWRLSFWYLVAPGTAGTCQARVTQHRDLPNVFKTLYDAEVVEPLTTVGRWVHVARVLRVEPEATALTLDFRINEAPVEVGELWVDDIRLDPLDNDAPAGP